MRCYTKEINISTSQPLEFIDITNQVRELVERRGISNGLVNICSKHTTTGVKINERCARLQQDMEEMLKEIAPQAKTYKHNEQTVDGRGNAHSHLMSLIVGSSETIPVEQGKLKLGTWQSIFFMEFDGPRSSRAVSVTIVGI
ncbi:MAG: secondary thiamine-phosphate synthase enzyme YjbQ [Pseudomonadota bacterium]